MYWGLADLKHFEALLEAALDLAEWDRIRLACALTRDYDGRTFEALAETWAVVNLGMCKAARGTAGIDGTLPDGRTLQVKSKRSGAHADAATYVTLSASTKAEADDLLVVFVDQATFEVTRTIGPLQIASLTARNGRYYVSDMIDDA